MATHFKGTSREKKVLNVYINMNRAMGAVAGVLEKFIAGHGLTPSQFGILETLSHRGSLCQKELGEKLLSTEGNITQLVDKLEKKELAVRVRSEKDRRYINIHLTDKGRELIERIFPEYVERLCTEMDFMKTGELETLAALSRKLGTKES